MVIPRGNPGNRKLFCCAKCGHRFHARAYNKRHRSPREWSLEQDNNGEQYRLVRLKPKDAKTGDSRYLAHLERNMCPNATEETLFRCPSHMMKDYYSTRRLCIVYAVLVDDMKECWAKDRQERYIRQYTTNDGYWLNEKEELAVHEEPQKGIVRANK